MTEPSFQRNVIGPRQRELSVPELFLSSEQAGWEGLEVRAYHEPEELEGWIDPVVPEIVLVLLVSGMMLMEWRRANGSWLAQSLRQGDLLLKPGGSVTGELRWRSLSPEPMQTIHIHLSHELFARTLQEVADPDPMHLTLFGRSGFQDPLLSQIGFALRQELEQPSSVGRLYAQTAAHLLAAHLVRYYTAPTPRLRESPQGLTPRQVGQVTDFILAHLHNDLSLTELAQQVGFSPHHFARLFRQATRESPHQYVLRQRLARAQHLLGETPMPLARIAIESGFANQSHLSRIFRQHLGITPRAYRQERVPRTRPELEED